MSCASPAKARPLLLLLVVVAVVVLLLLLPATLVSGEAVRRQGPVSGLSFLKAAPSQSGDRFGNAVAVDGPLMVVGAPDEASCARGIPQDNSCPDSGAAYVFERANETGAWSQLAYLKPDVVTTQNYFGLRVSISGSRVAVAAPNENSCTASDPRDPGCPDAGAVYIFERTARRSSQWLQTAYLKASNAAANDRFGFTLSLDGDRVAVGAFLEDSCATGVNGNATDDGCPNAGAVYVFDRDPTSGTWAETAYIKAPNADAGDYFSHALSLDGDQLAVGAYREDSCGSGIDPLETANGCPLSGAAYLFEFDVGGSGTWTQALFVKASNAETADDFGYAVGLHNDRLAVGARSEASCTSGNRMSNACPKSGAVYVFARDAMSRLWSEVAFLKAGNADTNDEFGWKLSLDGDHLLVGAPREQSCSGSAPFDNGCPSAGAAYLFAQQGSNSSAWKEIAYLKAPNVTNDDVFGWRVSLSGSTIALGVHSDDSCSLDPANNNCTASGAVYAYDLDRPSPPAPPTTGVATTAASATSAVTAVPGPSPVPPPPPPPPLPSSPAGPAPTPAANADGDDDDGDSDEDGGTAVLVAVIGAVGGCLLVVVLVAAAVVVFRRRRRGDDSSSSSSSAGSDEDALELSPDANNYHNLPVSSESPDTGNYHNISSAGGGSPSKDDVGHYHNIGGKSDDGVKG